MALFARKSPHRLSLWELMKMIDETLQELWSVKDNLAKEHAYDLDSLVDYLNEKYQSNIGTVQADARRSVKTELLSSDKLKTGHQPY